MKEKTRLLKVPDSSPLGQAEYDKRLKESLVGKHILLLHMVSVFPEKVLQAPNEEIAGLLKKVPGSRSIEDLARKEFFVTYFSPESSYFLDWVDIEGEAVHRLPKPSLTDQQTMITNARRIVQQKINRFMIDFVIYERWVKDMQLHVAKQNTESKAPNRIVASAKVLMVAEVEPSDVVKQASHANLFVIVAEGKDTKVHTYVNAASLAKAQKYKEWLHEKGGSSELPSDLRVL